MSPSVPLRYAVDVTRNDVDELDSFLFARLDSTRWKAGSEERRMGQALRSAVAVFTGGLNHHLSQTGIAQAMRDSMWSLRRVQEIRSGWNSLVDLAEPWGDHPDFNARWVRVRFYDAENEAQFAAYEPKKETSRR